MMAEAYARLPQLSPAFSGYLGLTVRAGVLQINVTKLKRRRILFWKKHWCSTILAETTVDIKVGEDIELEQRGARVVAKVNGSPVLWFGGEPDA